MCYHGDGTLCAYHGDGTLCVNLGNLSTLVKPYVKHLGVIFDPAFKFDKQVNAVVKASFFHLRTIAKIKSFLSFMILRRSYMPSFPPA